MGKKKKNEGREYFENSKTGSKTPVLRKKKNESEADFFARMSKMGYSNAKTLVTHFTDDEMALHTGKRDACNIGRCSSSDNKTKDSPPVEETKVEDTSQDPKSSGETDVIKDKEPSKEVIEEAIKEDSTMEPAKEKPKRKRGRPKKVKDEDDSTKAVE